jgi:hypothetical protein
MGHRAGPPVHRLPWHRGRPAGQSPVRSWPGDPPRLTDAAIRTNVPYG